MNIKKHKINKLKGKILPKISILNWYKLKSLVVPDQKLAW